MPPKPDLASHSLIHFLDRFVYRNAKAAAGGPKGTSIMQPLAGGDSRSVLVSNRAAKGHDSVNSEAFWRKKAEDVAVDEVFFHKYFSQIGKTRQGADKKKADKAKATEEEEEDENEDEIWQALVDSRPEVEGPSDDDSDLDMLDLEDSDDDDAASGDEGVDVEGTDDEVVVEDDADAASGASSDGDVGMFDDEDDLIESGDEAPSDMDELFQKELEVATPAEDGEEEKESRSKKRRKLKNLPTFASAEDYAAMMVDDDQD
jgi:ribosome biogenesis protein MAK21